MEVEFDPAKDEANLAKHGVSLQAAADFDFTTSLDREDTRFDYGEVRFVSIGFIGDRLYFWPMPMVQRTMQYAPSASAERRSTR